MSVAAPTSSLAQIRAKFRRVTGRPDDSQATNAEIDEYIQTAYVYDLPEHLRLRTLNETYTFTTIPNIDKYAFDRNKYVSVHAPLYVNGYQSFFSQNREEFYRIWPKGGYLVNGGPGSGSAGQTFQIAQRPITRARVRFNGTFDSDINFSILTRNASSQLFETTTTYIDDGDGGLVDSSYSNQRGTQPAPTVGSVDYLNGTFTITDPIPSTSEVRITTFPYTPGRPTAMLFYDDQFVLRPVPNEVYKISIEAHRNPLEFLTENDNPELNEWWQFLALAAALKAFEDQGEMEEYTKFYPIFEKYKLLVQRRTISQQTNQRTPSIYGSGASLSYYSQNHYGGF